jgi:hypothetical protein
MAQNAKAMIAPVAVTLALGTAAMLAFAGLADAAALKSVKWVCDVPGEGTVTFVAAPEPARSGIVKANSTAGETFNEQFGEVCHVE